MGEFRAGGQEGVDSLEERISEIEFNGGWKGGIQEGENGLGELC